MGGSPGGFRTGSWEYPPLDTAMQESGFEELEAYVLRSHNKVVQYIVKRTILYL